MRDKHVVSQFHLSTSWYQPRCLRMSSGSLSDFAWTNGFSVLRIWQRCNLQLAWHMSFLAVLSMHWCPQEVNCTKFLDICFSERKSFIWCLFVWQSVVLQLNSQSLARLPGSTTRHEESSIGGWSRFSSGQSGLYTSWSNLCQTVA